MPDALVLQLSIGPEEREEKCRKPSHITIDNQS